MTACRTLAAALAAALVAASLHATLARWAAGDLATIFREAGREEALARRLATAQRFSEGRHRITAELIAGRITLGQAVERVHGLNALIRQGDGEDGAAPFLLAGGEEALWRNVLLWAETWAGQRRASDAAEVLDRLADEYRERFGHEPYLGAVMPLTP